MKKLEIIIRPTKLQEVKEELGKIGVKGMTVSEVMGCGLQKGRTAQYRGNQYEINLLPKVKIEIIIPDNMIDEIVKGIRDTAATGEIGDGKIFIYPVENAVRIRTGESGDEAI